MINIFICEDDLNQRNQMEKYINNYILIEELNMNIALSTANPHDLLTHITTSSSKNNLYFLDVDLNCDIDGITLATKIRQLDDLARIVFVTTHDELVPSIFKHKIEALDYIVKGEELKQNVLDCLQTVHQRYSNLEHRDQPLYKVKANGTTHLVPLQDIMFFTTTETQKKIILCLENSELLFRGKLKDIALSNPLFVRAHHSIVVHIANIQSIDRTNMVLTLKNGQTCVTSIRGLRLLDQALNAMN